MKVIRIDTIGEFHITTLKSPVNVQYGLCLSYKKHRLTMEKYASKQLALTAHSRLLEKLQQAEAES